MHACAAEGISTSFLWVQISHSGTEARAPLGSPVVPADGPSRSRKGTMRPPDFWGSAASCSAPPLPSRASATSPAGHLGPGTGTVSPGTPSNPTSPAERKLDHCEMRAGMQHKISAVQDAFPRTKWCLLAPGCGSRVGKLERSSAKRHGGAQDPL